MCGTEAKHSMPAAQVVMRVHLGEEKCFARGVFFFGNVAKHCPDICDPETDEGHLELC
jgi:hypothetical protein